MLGRKTLWMVVACAVVLSACGKSDERKPATQVAAKVNGDEISVHQINTALMSAGVATADPKQAGRQVLERLIDQQLLIQKATEAKLDRDANVLTAIENARRQILAQAYVERTVTEAARPTGEDIKKYYADHPELFRDRRLYRFQEVLASVDSEEKMQKLQAALDKMKSLNEVTNYLRGQGMPFNVSFTLKASEQMPAPLLGKVRQLKPGDILFFPAGNNAVIVLIGGSQELPLSEAEAAPYIFQVLSTQKRAEQANEEVKRLRTAAKVEYLGDYAKEPVAQGPGADAPAKTEQAAGKDAKSNADKADNGGLIDKALTGLK